MISLEETKFSHRWRLSEKNDCFFFNFDRLVAILYGAMSEYIYRRGLEFLSLTGKVEGKRDRGKQHFLIVLVTRQQVDKVRV